MADHHLHVTARCVAVFTTATCGACATLVAIKVPFAEIETRFADIRCPRCKAVCDLDENTVVPEIEITGPNGKEIVTYASDHRI